MDTYYIKSRSQWYQKIETQLDQYLFSLDKKEAGRYKLDLLRRIAGRVDEFADTCGECQTLKQEVSRLVQELSLLIQMPSKNGTRSHTRAVSKLAEHLKKTHKLVDKGHYMGIGVSIGTAVGAGLGGLLRELWDNAGIGTGAGIVLGLAIGAYLDRKAREEDRVL